MTTIYLLLVTCYLLLYAFLAWRRLNWALALILFALPSYQIRFQIGPLPLTLLEGMILILFAVWLVRKNFQFSIFNFQQIFNFQFSIPIALFLTAATISVSVSPDLRAALGIWKTYFIEPILFFIVFISAVREKKDLQLIFYALGTSALIISIFAIIQEFTGWLIPNEFWQAEATRRVTSFFPYPNAIGLYLAPIIILAFGQLSLAMSFPFFSMSFPFFSMSFPFFSMSFPRKRESTYNNMDSRSPIPTFVGTVEDKFCGNDTVENKHLNPIINSAYWLIITFTSFLAIVFARSEGAIIAVLTGLIFMGLIIKKSRWWTAGLTVLLILIILSVPAWRTFMMEKATFQDISGQIRLAEWQETWQMLKAQPIFGAGLAGYQKTIEPYHQEGIFFNKENDPDFQRKIVIFDEKYKQKFWQPVEIYLYPHNIIFNFWSETGLLGLIAFIWIIIYLFYLGFKKLKGKKLIVNSQLLIVTIMAAMAAIIVHGLVDVPYFKNDLSIMFWLFVGLMVVIPPLKIRGGEGEL